MAEPSSRPLVLRGLLAYEGRGTFRRNTETYAITPGLLFLARPGEPHEIVSARDEPLGIAFWAHTLTTAERRGPPPGGHRQPGWSADALPTDNLPVDILLALTATGGPAVCRSPEAIPAVLDLLAREAADPGPGTAAIISGLATSLVVHTARAFGSGLGVGAGRPATAVSRSLAADLMIRYIEDNLDRPVHVRDVAAQASLSERHAARLFRDHTGMSIHDYLTQRRLRLAIRLLRGSPTRTVEAVGRACGYGDVHHFITVFRRHLGEPPARYRRRRA